ncbi:MAG: class I SAM-dependent methyltransferase [Candidatus Woesearchaeota archaeon]
MATYYDRIASSYDELHGSEQLEKIHTCMHFIEPDKTERLLDVGCGTGVSTEPWICESHGIDPSKELIKIAREKRKNSTYTIGSAENIPYENESFDYVISITSIQNFSDIDTAMKEMRRVLKKDGKIVISTLKDSSKIKSIEEAIEREFTVNEIYEGRIDMFFIGYKQN